MPPRVNVKKRRDWWDVVPDDRVASGSPEFVDYEKQRAYNRDLVAADPMHAALYADDVIEGRVEPETYGYKPMEDVGWGTIGLRSMTNPLYPLQYLAENDAINNPIRDYLAGLSSEQSYMGLEGANRVARHYPAPDPNDPVFMSRAEFNRTPYANPNWSAIPTRDDLIKQFPDIPGWRRDQRGGLRDKYVESMGGDPGFYNSSIAAGGRGFPKEQWRKNRASERAKGAVFNEEFPRPTDFTSQADFMFAWFTNPLVHHTFDNNFDRHRAGIDAWKLYEDNLNNREKLDKIFRRRPEDKIKELEAYWDENPELHPEIERMRRRWASIYNREQVGQSQSLLDQDVPVEPNNPLLWDLE